MHGCRSEQLFYVLHELPSFIGKKSMRDREGREEQKNFFVVIKFIIEIINATY